MTIYYYPVRCDAVRSGIRGFKMGHHLSLLTKYLTGQKVTNHEMPYSKLLVNFFLFTCLFNDVASNSGYCI